MATITQAEMDKYDAPNIVQELGKEDKLAEMEVEVMAAGPIKMTPDNDSKLRDLSNKVRQSIAKRTLQTREVFEDIVATYGDPLQALAEIGFNRANEPHHRIAALKELASYGHSKLKTIEHTGANGAPLEFKMTTINQILELAASQNESSTN